MKKTLVLWLLALVLAANLALVPSVDAYAIDIDLDFESLGSSASRPADTNSDGIVWVEIGTFNCLQQEHQHTNACFRPWNPSCPHNVYGVHRDDECHEPITTADCTPCTAGSSCTRQHYTGMDTSGIVEVVYRSDGTHSLRKNETGWALSSKLRQTLATAIINEFKSKYPNGTNSDTARYHRESRPWHIELTTICTHVCSDACIEINGTRSQICKLNNHIHGGSSCYGAPYTWKKYYDVNNNGVADKDEDLIITFDLNGGKLDTGSATMTMKATRFLWPDLTVTLFPTVSRSGCTFSGWYADSALTQTVAARYPSNPPVGNVTFYAGWKLNVPTVMLSLSGKTLIATVSHEITDLTYQYEWYKDGEKVDGSADTLQASGVGDYSVKVKATDGTLVSEAAISNTVSVEHQHEWSYIASGDTITAICTADAENCPDMEQSICLLPPANLTYDGSEKPASVEGSIDGVELPAIQYSASPVNAGDCVASITLGNATASIKYTIQKADPSIEWADQTVPYTGKEANLDAPAVKLIGSDTFSGTISYTYGTAIAPVNAGMYTVTASIPEQTNYNAAEKTISLAIEKAVITVIPDALSKFYSADDPELTYTHSDAVNGEIPAFTGKLEREEGEDAGSYLITLGTLALADNGSFKADNYDLKLADGSHFFTIGQSDAELTVSVGSEYTYGETITVAGTLEATGTAPAADTYVLRSVQQPTASLYFEATKLASAPVVDGRYTLTYNTTDKRMPVGENLPLTVSISGGSNTAKKSETVYTTLKPKQLTGEVTSSTTKVYDGTADVLDASGLQVNFTNIEEADAGKLTSTADFAFADAEPGQNKAVIASNIQLDPYAEYYELIKDFYTVPETVAGDVGEITRIPLTAYTNPADAEMDEHCADAAAVIAKLPAEVTYTTASSESVALNVSWACGSYNNTPNAENTFTWTVDETDSDLIYYMIADGVPATDSITVTNDDIIPVTVTGTDDATTYNGSAYDVSGMFTVTPDETTGAKTYSIADGGTGEGTLDGSVLTITKAGTFEITLSVAESIPYAAATGTAALTVNKGDAAIPTGLTAYYSQKLGEIDLPEGWKWQDENAEVGSRGSNTHLADYEGNDLYAEKKNAELTVTVSQADTQLDVQGESDYYYGENIELTVKVTAVKPAVRKLLRSSAAGTVSVWNGSAKLFEQAADNGDIISVSIGTLENGLTPGSYTLDVKYTASDDMNAASTSKAITVRLLENAPDALISAPNENGWYKADPTLTAPEGCTIALTMEGPYGSSVTPETTDGENTITYYIRNEDGQIGEKTVKVHVDKTAPVIESVTAAPTDTTAKITVSATDEPSGVDSYALTSASGVTIVNNGDGTFDVSGMNADTEYSFTLTVTDKAGNSSTATVTVKTDKQPVILFPMENTEVHVFIGHEAEMKVVAENAYRYEWYVSYDDGETFVRVPNANTPVHVIGYALMKDDGALYFCRAYGKSGVLYADSPLFEIRVEDPGAVPQTGDDTNIALLLTLMLGSMAMMIVFSRKRRMN